MKSENKISKPISIIRKEFIISLTTMINESNLPPFIIEPILKDAYNDVRFASQKQLELDKKRYNESLKMEDKS